MALPAISNHGGKKRPWSWRSSRKRKAIPSRRSRIALSTRSVKLDVLDALHDIRARNARNERVGKSEDLITRVGREVVVSPEEEQRRREDEEDEKLVREVFSKVSMPVPGAGPSHETGEDGEATSTVVTVKRKADDVEPDLKSLLPEGTRAMVHAMSASLQPAKKKKAGPSKSLGIKLVKKKDKAVVAS